MRETNEHKPVARILLALLLFEFSVFLFSGVGFHSLCADPFFSFDLDVFHIGFYYLHIPQFIVRHLWVGYCLDASIIVLIIALLRQPANQFFILLLILLLFTYYITLTGYHTHSNYQMGFVIALFPFLFKSKKNRAVAFECVRYYILFFYVSSAYLKMASGSIFHVAHFSHVIKSQFLPYFLEGNTGYRTSLNIFLIKHTGIACIFYLAGFFVELAALAGFFTKKYDTFLCILLLLFHFVNWFLMDIAPFGQITLIGLLLFSSQFKRSNNYQNFNAQYIQ